MVSRRRPSPRALAALSLLAAPAVGQGQVWVVDDGGGAGVDFTAIQAAVDAASDGDLVLVKAGDYAQFTIDAKALTVIADAGAAVSFTPAVGAVRVRNLASSQAVSLRGLGVTASFSVGNYAPFAATSNAGPLWVEGCQFAIDSSGVAAGASVQSCSSAAFLRCKVAGLPYPFTLFYGGPGLLANGSSVHVFDSTFEGSTPNTFAFGGAGAELENGFLFSSGSTLRGGSISTSCQAFDCHTYQGSPGLYLKLGGHVERLDTAIVGGFGSTSGGSCGSGLFTCSFGATGPAVFFGGGTLNVMTEASRSFEVGSPIRAGQSATLTAQGNPGDFVVALYSFQQQHTFLPNIGTLLVPLSIGAETGFVVLGATNPVGALSATVPFAPFPAGLEYLQIYLQAAFVTAQPVIIVGGGSLLVVLNQSF